MGEIIGLKALEGVLLFLKESLNSENVGHVSLVLKKTKFI